MRVLVVYKKSRYRIYVLERKNRRLADLVSAEDPSVNAMWPAHEAHERTLARVIDRLREGGADVVVRYRAISAARDGFDLIVTVGGDGTLLEAARGVTSTPVLAVNSSPAHSVGFFCGATPDDLDERIRLALGRKLPITPLARAQSFVDGQAVGPPVLNDVLFCHPNPATTSRYILQIGRRREVQKSSGIWIGTPAGSSAAQRSAGGDLLPIRARQLQYVVREPYSPLGRPPLRLVKGVVGPASSVRVVNQMRLAMLFVDGGHRFVEIDMGQTLDVRQHPDPLRLLGFRGR